MENVRRVYGPYNARDKWRLVFLYADGQRKARLYDTKADALAEMQRYDLERGITVRRAVDEYLAEMGETAKPRTVRTTRDRLMGLLATVLNAPVQSLTKVRAEALMDEYAQERAGDTVLNTLSQTRTWGRYAVSRGWVCSSPWDGVKVKVKRRRGKKQLRLTELRALTTRCLAENSDASVAVLTSFLLGMRASEVVQLSARDIDDEGRLLWIDRDNTKTDSGERGLEVPPVLSPLLYRRARGRSASERIFSTLNRFRLYHHTRRLCREAGVPEVCPHSLRGAHATLARIQGVASQAVAQAIGHSTDKITNAHYVDQAAVMRSVVERVVRDSGEENEPGAISRSPNPSNSHPES